MMPGNGVFDAGRSRRKRRAVRAVQPPTYGNKRGGKSEAGGYVYIYKTIKNVEIYNNIQGKI